MFTLADIFFPSSRTFSLFLAKDLYLKLKIYIDELRDQDLG